MPASLKLRRSVQVGRTVAATAVAPDGDGPAAIASAGAGTSGPGDPVSVSTSDAGSGSGILDASSSSAARRSRAPARSCRNAQTKASVWAIDAVTTPSSERISSPMPSQSAMDGLSG